MKKLKSLSVVLFVKLRFERDFEGMGIKIDCDGC